MKTVVTSAKKSAAAKKPTLAATAKKSASAPAKTAAKKASRSSSNPPAEKPAPKTQSKQVKSPNKPVVAKAASKSLNKPASKDGRTTAKAATEGQLAAGVPAGKTKMPTSPAVTKSVGKSSTKTTAPKSGGTAIASDNKNAVGSQSGKNLSDSKAKPALEGKIEQLAVSKVREVATNTMKSTPSAASGSAVLTEEQILKMREEDYMNPAQLAFFKARLQQLEKDLLKNADETTEHLRETVLVPDPADRATIEEEHALELRTRDRERKLLKKVQQSLASIESGDYGWCEETGEPIGIPRLLARPTATLSLEAQQRRELKQKLYGD